MLMEEQLTDQDCVSVHTLKDYMERAGFTGIATSIALRELQRKKLITTTKEQDERGYDYTGCWLTTEGEDWVLNNQDKVKITYAKENEAVDPDSELPF